MANIVWHLLATFVTVLVLFSLLEKNVISAFNLSPVANLIIKDPQLVTPLPKNRSSYFGFSMSLRPKGVIVGAPQAQSTLKEQDEITETGAIYKCSLVDGTCTPYVFERNGNVNSDSSTIVILSEKRDFQWLGATMDGGTKDTDKLLVCAPRLMAPTESHYFLHGVCYWVKNTLGESPEKVTKISPLRYEPHQIMKVDSDDKIFYYAFSELGLSAHVSDDNEEFLIGAPGIHTWKGSVIRYRQKNIHDEPILSKRDTTSNKSHRIRQKSSAGNSVTVKDEIDILKPERWGQPEDSYFGYGVGSGYFDSTNPQKLLYVATAPQANEQSGEAYIFDIRGEFITKHVVFRGSQFGEYFGYSVLADDLNGDGLTDVVVSAPQYAHENSHDNGAIYVFINRGNFNFDQILLKSPLTDSARFGTTLSRLGDLNHDGFNDIAVGAPFADNGTVFVYLGSEKGIREQHSQRLNSPQSVESKYGTHMFGHGLSKGSDIDDNGFNDLAVGAPNAEAIFVYRAYPVVKAIASVKANTLQIKPDQTKITLIACYGIETKSQILNQVELDIRLIVDSKVNRVKFTKTQTNKMRFNATAGISQQCHEFDCDVRDSVADIFKPIELEMHYNVVNQIPDSQVFCETCAAVDPADAKVYTDKIYFNTGCLSICKADLKLTSSGFSSDYVIGSSNTLKVNYEITNSGEPAYSPQINITSSNRMPFAQIPSNCKLTNNYVMVCDLNSGTQINKDGKTSTTVIFDVGSIKGDSMTISAQIFSGGLENSVGDNILHDVITLKEITDIEIVGKQMSDSIDLENFKNSTEITNEYDIRSHGPSTAGAIEVAIYIPFAYNVSGVIIPIVDPYNMKISAKRNEQLFDVKKFIPTFAKPTILGQDNVFKSIITTKPNSFSAVTSDQYALVSKSRTDKDLKGKLPRNQTIIFSCEDQDELTLCARAVVQDFKLKPEEFISITMHSKIDLNEVNEILREPWDFFVIKTNVNVTRISATANQSLNIISKIEPNIISKHHIYSISIWYIILATIIGILLLTAIVYTMHKHGFFKRAKKEEMARLKQQGNNESEESGFDSECS